MRFVVGCSGWMYRWWVGRFYPNDTPPWKMLDEYQKRLSAVEVNATFYRSFKYQTAYDWRRRTNERFKFILKVPKTVSHEQGFNVSDLKSFKLLIRHLGFNFEGVLLQLPPSREADIDFLKQKIDALDVRPIFVEFRHDSWYQDLDSVMRLGSVPVHPIWHDGRYELPLKRTLNQKSVYLRFHGTQGFAKGEYGSQELQEYVLDTMECGYKTVYAFFNNDWHGGAAFDAMRLKEITQ